ncbi:hypothetical protein MRX96_009715 [Rhipicephalus microplus]
MWTRQAKPEATAASRLAHADEPIGNPKRRGSGRVAAAQFVRVGRRGVTERSRGSPQGSPPEGCHRQMASAGRRPPPPEQPPRRDGGAKMAAAGKALGGSKNRSDSGRAAQDCKAFEHLTARALQNTGPATHNVTFHARVRINEPPRTGFCTRSK